MGIFMVCLVFITLIICATILVWKYIDEGIQDMSWSRYNDVLGELRKIKQMLENNNKE